ncbi:cuticular protein 2 [Andrena cerasifolii]|uniref:cuticular protein 2 n=1 Tax=Andrena cerasifolii TaxID=2819439 RepID=UPI004038440F
MVFKFVALATLVAAANAGVLSGAALSYAPAAPLAYAAPAAPLTYAAQAAPLAYAKTLAVAPITKAVVTKTVDADYDPHPQYSYAYDVHDALTGDAKSQQESRDGDVVQGSYSLIDADGTKRTVDYTADPVNGFNAVVRKEPAAVAVKAIAAAPVAHAAPLAYASPVAKLAPALYAAPAAKLAAPLTYAHAAPVAVAHAAPIAYSAHPAPIAYSAHPSPYAKLAAAPALSYAAAPALSYAAAPALSYAAAPAHYL